MLLGRSYALFTQLPTRGQPVEKLDAGLICSPKSSFRAAQSSTIGVLEAKSRASSRQWGLFQQAGVFSETRIAPILMDQYRHPARVGGVGAPSPRSISPICLRGRRGRITMRAPSLGRGPGGASYPIAAGHTGRRPFAARPPSCCPSNSARHKYLAEPLSW